MLSSLVFGGLQIASEIADPRNLKTALNEDREQTELVVTKVATSIIGFTLLRMNVLRLLGYMFREDTYALSCITR